MKRRKSDLSNHDLKPEKHQRFFTIEDLSDEMQLKIFTYLSVKDLIHCGQVSTRTRRICQDESLWQKVNLFGKIVPADFIQYVLDNGCKFINLSYAEIRGDLKLHGKTYKVKYLNLSRCDSNFNAIEELISSCQSLQKLSLSTLNMIGSDAMINNGPVHVLI